jgi:hypothetical protein
MVIVTRLHTIVALILVSPATPDGSGRVCNYGREAVFPGDNHDCEATPCEEQSATLGS